MISTNAPRILISTQAEIKRLEATPCYFMAPMRKTPTERAMEQLEKDRKEALAEDY